MHPVQNVFPFWCCLYVYHFNADVISQTLFGFPIGTITVIRHCTLRHRTDTRRQSSPCWVSTRTYWTTPIQTGCVPFVMPCVDFRVECVAVCTLWRLSEMSAWRNKISFQLQCKNIIVVSLSFLSASLSMPSSMRRQRSLSSEGGDKMPLFCFALSRTRRCIWRRRPGTSPPSRCSCPCRRRSCPTTPAGPSSTTPSRTRRRTSQWPSSRTRGTCDVICAFTLKSPSSVLKAHERSKKHESDIFLSPLCPELGRQWL